MGDYGAEFIGGHRPPIYFDRKSISDLYGTMGGGYVRFKKCIGRATDEGSSLFIIVEGTFTKVLGGCKYSKIRGISMIRKLMTLWLRHGVQTVFVKDRGEMVNYLTEFYISCGREYLRKQKEG